MRCNSCGSVEQQQFAAEVALHSSGRKRIDDPALFVFPKVVVCSDCGAAEFTVPETELRALSEVCGTAVA